MLQWSRPALLVTLIVLATAAQRSRGELCTLGGQRYRVGQTWHPILAPFGENACINCTCYQDGEVKCEAIDCPRPQCEEPKIVHGQCCPSCNDGRAGSKENEDQSPGCDFDGDVHSNGDVFPSVSTGLRPTRPDQCVMCVCSMGEVFCQLKTCLPTNCRRFVHVEDDCCPHCADGSGPPGNDNIPYILSHPADANSSDTDCTSPMGTHANGSTWKPVLETYGEMGCINCTCLNGNITCGRVSCPAEEASLPCDHPRRVNNPCCPQCPSPTSPRPKDKVKDEVKGKDKGKSHSSEDKVNRKQQSRKRGNGKRKKNRRKGKKRTKGQKRRKCKPQETVHPERKADVTSVAAILGELCLPRNTDRLLYRLHENGQDKVAIDSITDNTLDIYLWTLDNSKLQNTMSSSANQTEQFRHNVTCNQILGATNKRGARKLVKKMEGTLRKCRKRKKKRCTSNTLDKVLKRDRRLKPVVTQGVCGQ